MKLEVVFVKPHSPEWDYIWDYVTNHPINKDIEEPRVAQNGSHAWRYMGTTTFKSEAIHTVKHTLHPTINDATVITIRASEKYYDSTT